MGFIGTIFFLLIFVALFVLVLGLNLLARLVGGIRNLWYLLTGKGFTPGGRNRNTGYYTGGNAYNNQSTAGGAKTSGESTDQGHRPHSKGVFGDDEGTYVDFEEIKE